MTTELPPSKCGAQYDPTPEGEKGRLRPTSPQWCESQGEAKSRDFILHVGRSGVVYPRKLIITVPPNRVRRNVTSARSLLLKVLAYFAPTPIRVRRRESSLVTVSAGVGVRLSAVMLNHAFRAGCQRFQPQEPLTTFEMWSQYLLSNHSFALYDVLNGLVIHTLARYDSAE